MVPSRQVIGRRYGSKDSSNKDTDVGPVSPNPGAAVIVHVAKMKVIDFMTIERIDFREKFRGGSQTTSENTGFNETRRWDEDCPDERQQWAVIGVEGIEGCYVILKKNVILS